MGGPPRGGGRTRKCPIQMGTDTKVSVRDVIVKNFYFSMNWKPTPLTRTLRGEIDPADSENDDESVDSQKPSFFNEFEANSAHTNPMGGNRPR